jgi:hypothetical protein
VITDPLGTQFGQVPVLSDGTISFFDNDPNIDPDDSENRRYVDIATDGKTIKKVYDRKLSVDPSAKMIGFLAKDPASGKSFFKSAYAADVEAPVQFMPTPDSCDITKVVIQHLDGTKLEDCEWDKIHRFIRLWRKLGWTINETDKAVMAFGCPLPVAVGEGGSTDGSSDCFSEFKDDCTTTSTGDCGCGGSSADGNKKCGCGNCDITQAVIHQLVYVKKLLDATGLELVKLLTFWNNITTYGDKKNPSLYARLFLSANMLGVDTVFKADSNGNYLATPQKISEHIPVLMAGFNLKAEDISSILKLGSIDPDAAGSLNLKNISFIYR